MMDLDGIGAFFSQIQKTVIGWTVKEKVVAGVTAAALTFGTVGGGYLSYNIASGGRKESKPKVAEEEELVEVVEEEQVIEEVAAEPQINRTEVEIPSFKDFRPRQRRILWRWRRR